MKNKILKSSNINITKIILVIIIIASFAGIMYFVIKYFKESCPEGSTFIKSFNKCVEICPPGQVNVLDGSCKCPNANDNYVNNKCVPKCTDPKPDLCGGICINSNFTKCLTINGIDTPCPNDNVCGDYCVTPGFMCTKGKIMYPLSDTFILNESQNSITITIPANPQGYLLTGIFPSTIEKAINDAKPKFNYTVKNDTDNPKKLIFTVTNNLTAVQPILNFKSTLNPEKLGFSKDEYTFTNNTLLSKYSIEDYTLIETKCTNPGEENCGNDCCKSEDCIQDECCTDKYNKEKCGTGCCLKKNEKGKGGCCDGICCKPENNEECIDGKCQRLCEYKGVDGKTPVYCDTNNPQNACISVPNQNNNGEYMSYCGNIKCRFTNEVPTPADIQGIPVCQTSDVEHPSPLFYSKFVPNKGLIRSTTTKFSVPADCTENDCVKKLAEVGADDFKADPNGNVCNTTFNCETVLEDLKDTDTCPLSNQNQCCIIGGKFKGQVCKDDFFAVPVGDDECMCVKGWGSFNDPHGKVCKIIKDGDDFNGTIYPTSAECLKKEGGCNIGWVWDKQGEQNSNCNYFLCRDNKDRPREDMWTAELQDGILRCFHKSPSYDPNAKDLSGNGKYCHMSQGLGQWCNNCNEPLNSDIFDKCKDSSGNWVGEQYRCNSFKQDQPVPGYLPACCPDLFSCNTAAVDISGFTVNSPSIRRIDKLTGQYVEYESGGVLPLNSSGDYECEGQGHHPFNACPYDFQQNMIDGNTIPDPFKPSL